MDPEKNQADIHKGTIVAIGIIAVIILTGILVFYMTHPSRPAELPEQLIIASGSPEFSALTLVAQEQGYFSEHGLNVTIHDYPTGPLAINELLAGRADMAYAAEFVGVSTSFRSPDLRIIGSTAKSDVIALVIRNDRGVSKPSDLKGKKIAVPKGTAAEFYLGRYLTLNGMDIRDVTVNYLAPADLVKSVVSGDSDAAIIWEPVRLPDRTTARPEWHTMACPKWTALFLGHLYQGRHDPGPARGYQGLYTCPR